jgi:ZIP family zinc transporter
MGVMLMSDTLKIILYSSAAGLPIIIGGLISNTFQSKKIKIKEEVNHWVIAFGGGALLSAISFALIPKAITELPFIELVIIFLSGTVLFMFVDILIGRTGGSFALAMSMMMDFIPEALALGASFAYNNNFGLLLAIFIGLQNLPEGFNSYIELRKKLNLKLTLLLMLGLSFIGIFASLSGKYLLSNNPKIISSILLFAAGGILYLVFQDIAPLSKGKNDWIPATGASIGFLIGMIAEKLLQ